MTYYSTLKETNFKCKTWISLKNIMLNKGMKTQESTHYDFIYTKHLEQGKPSNSYRNQSCLKVEVARGSGGDHLERSTKMLGIGFICKL